MTQANFTPENISDDESQQGLRLKARNNFNYVQIALNAIQSWVTQSFSDLQDTIIKPAIRGGFAINDIRYYGTLASAVANIPSTSAQTVYITNSQAITADLTVPSNISIVVANGGLFTISAAKILTFNGSFDAQGNALADVFAGAGAYHFGKAVRLIGAGAPEGAITAPIGSEYLRNDGGTLTVLYIKESGAGNTGWVSFYGSGGLLRSSSLTINGSVTNRGYGIFGASGSTQIQIDDDEIQAMSNNTPATLALNARGGATVIGLAGAGSILTVYNQTLFYGATSWNVGFATGPSTVTVSGVYSIYSSDTTGGNVILNLPNATLVAATGRVYTFSKSDTSTNTVTVTPSGAQTIDGAATLVLGGNTGQSRLVIYSDGTNWRILELYEAGTYTATLTGFASGPTQTVYYVRDGKTVTIRYASFNGTSNATTMTATGMPSHLWPISAAATVIVYVRDNGSDYVGNMSISTAGVWSPFYQNAINTNTNVYTNVGTKGLDSANFSYSVQ